MKFRLTMYDKDPIFEDLEGKELEPGTPKFDEAQDFTCLGDISGAVENFTFCGDQVTFTINTSKLKE